MEGEAPASAPAPAVFLSYASQDAEAAQRICAALRSAGVDVWFDQSELRGGEAWDRQIRKRIHDCALFVPIISAHSDARQEGYFRREWRLAVERAGDMAEDVEFLLPVVIDSTADATARVPDRFREVQWSRLPGGQASPAFIARVERLLAPARGPAAAAQVAAPRASGATLKAPRHGSGLSRSTPAVSVAIAIAVFAALAYLVADKFFISRRAAPSPPAMTAQQAPSGTSTAALPFAPPAHSIAVLPFANLSGDASQDYFSDGLTEELLNSLAQINELQVAARTSSFSFKEHPDIVTVAHKLNVAAVLEGSVRRSEHTVRVTAQLINAVTGFHLWSRTYDRDLGDVLKLQTEIATAVASALKVTLLGDVSAKIELGGTRNPAAFDAYLRASAAFRTFDHGKDLQAAIAGYAEAIGLDPNYAVALAGRSRAYSTYAGEFAHGAAIREFFDKAIADARRALALAPELADGEMALADYFAGGLDFAHASEAYERALALAPGNAQLLDSYGRFAVWMGRADAGISAARHAVALDPLNPSIVRHLGQGLVFARRYDEAVVVFRDGLALDPESARDRAFLGLAYYLQGDLRNAQSACEINSDKWLLFCLALTYDSLQRHADAQAKLASYIATSGDSAAYQYAQILAQWGDLPKALEWLDTAVRLRDSGLVYVKTDPLMDPLRNEPRFQAIERALKFPN